MYTIKAFSIFALVFSLRSTQALASLTKRTPDGWGYGTACTASVQQGLGQQLSPGASIVLPGSQTFADANVRWSPAEHPDFAIVVVPATDQDVAATVQYANSCNYPFLAVNRGHGTALDLNNVHRGINIFMRNLTSISVAPDGNSITAGGGVYVDQVIKGLAARGKVAATGACACVGGLGTALGGGFGRVQGFYGLVADNFLEMTVVIANGSIVTANNQQNSDLFWALRGAGHNFGIVTSFQAKIYPATPTWYTATYIFTQDRLEAVFQLLGRFNANGAQQKQLVTYTLIALNPAFGRVPVIIVSIQYAGPQSEASRFCQPLEALHPFLVTWNQTIPYVELADAVGTGLTSPICVEGDSSSRSSFPVGVLTFNVTAICQIYNLFSELVTRYPDFNQSVVQFESESMTAVRQLKDEDTAYAHRADNALFALLTQYKASPANDAVAPQYGQRFRAIALAGDGPGRQLNAYVNYAYGDETVEQIYGYDQAKLQKLRALKQQYDPLGKFNFFHPIIPPGGSRRDSPWWNP
ncbi:MAG: hypothetical protein Q9218_005877 [Villophora microphyllina]